MKVKRLKKMQNENSQNSQNHDKKEEPVKDSVNNEVEARPKHVDFERFLDRYQGTSVGVIVLAFQHWLKSQANDEENISKVLEIFNSFHTKEYLTKHKLFIKSALESFRPTLQQEIESTESSSDDLMYLSCFLKQIEEI